MPTSEHEMPIEFLRNRPQLAATRLERVFGISAPEHDQASLDVTDCTDNQQKEFRADAVVVLRHQREARLAVVVEVQRGRKEEKRFAWPVYLATVRARLECPAILLVICPGRATARWAREPIAMGHPKWALRPLVVSYDEIPLVTSAAEGRAMPELAVLSALAHGGKSRRTLVACAEALKSLPKERFKLLPWIPTRTAVRVGTTQLGGLHGADGRDVRGLFRRPVPAGRQLRRKVHP